MTATPENPNPQTNDFLKKDDEQHGSTQVPGSATPSYGVPPQPAQESHHAPSAYPDASTGNYPSYPAPQPQQGQQQGMYANPQGYVPQTDMLTEAKKPQNLSLIYGIGSLVNLFVLTWFFAPLGLLSPVLSILGILEAKKAERFGIDATAGKVVSWVSLIISVLGVFLILILIFGFLALMASGMH
jgi:hypothetical protein